MIQIIVWLVVVGLILYLVNTYIPMQPPIPLIINIVVVVCLIIWLLNWSGLGNMPAPSPLRR